MKKKQSLLPIFITVFIDLVGVGIVAPVLAHLFLDANGILPIEYEFSKRMIFLGLLTATYPLMQFFGSPILGALSDRHGRKKVLTVSLFGTFLGYLFFAYGILTKNLLMLFISRAVDGFTGGNISTALSAIADLSDEKEKAKNFGLIGMAFGLGFILGPYLGGVLSDSSVLPWFTHSTPFFFAALLCLFNIVLVMLRFQETLKTRSNTKISLLTGFRNIKRAFKMENLRTLFFVVFLATFGFNFYTQFFQVYLIEKFNFSQLQIGNLFAYLGLCAAIVQGILIRPISKVMKPEKVLTFSIIGLSASIPMLLLPDIPLYLYFVIPFISFFNGISLPNINALISNLGAKDSQGEILGISQSVQSLAMTIPPVIAGMIVTINRNLPLIVSGSVIFAAWLVFVLFFRGKIHRLFHEV